MEKLAFHFEWNRGSLCLCAQATLDQKITVLVGPSGGGKTSLVKLLAGHERPTRGRLQMGSDVLVDTESDTYVPAWKRGFGVVFQESRLWPHQRVRQQIQFGGVDRESEVIHLCGVEPLLERWPDTLSGGEKQRVALARTLMSAPRFLLLDEPLVSLDAGSRRTIMNVLSQVRSSFDVPMIYVTHDMGEALHLSDSFLFMHEGSLSGPAPLFDHAQRPGLFEPVSKLGLESILLATVTEDDEALGVCRSNLGKAQVTSARNPASVGSTIRLGVQPQDVLLAQGPVQNISARNSFEGTVKSIREVSGHLWVEVDIGQSLFAEITREAAQALAIEKEAKVTVIVKSSALRYRGIN
jgi:molybdate transport system ATP-binding protein